MDLDLVVGVDLDLDVDVVVDLDADIKLVVNSDGTAEAIQEAPSPRTNTRRRLTPGR